MPAPKFRADYSGLDQIASQFGQQAQATAQTLQRLNQAIDTLQNGDWVGAGATAFYAEMSGTVLPALKRLQAALANAQQVTAQISQLTQRAESDAAAVLRGQGGGPSASPPGSETEASPPGSGGIGGTDKVGAGRGGGTPTNDGLKNNLTELLKTSPPDYAQLTQAIENATQAERDVVWKDTALMDQMRGMVASGDLSAKQYLALLPKLQMLQPGTVAHSSAADADKYIRDYLKDMGYGDSALDAGRQISGAITVVDTKDWLIACEDQLGPNWRTDQRNINAFVGDDGLVWIHKDRGNPGTTIHEATHKYADDAIYRTSWNLNEGMTEYFTREVLDDAGKTVSRTNYQDNYELVSSLANFVGEDVVAKSFFDGDVAGLKQAFIDKGRTAREWDTFINHIDNGDWAEADALLTTP